MKEKIKRILYWGLVILGAIIFCLVVVVASNYTYMGRIDYWMIKQGGWAWV